MAHEYGPGELPGREPLKSGFSIGVNESRTGRRSGRIVDAKRISGKQALTLIDVDQDEMPLSLLDANGRYPIPSLYDDGPSRRRVVAPRRNRIGPADWIVVSTAPMPAPGR